MKKRSRSFERHGGTEEVPAARGVVEHDSVVDDDETTENHVSSVPQPDTDGESGHAMNVASEESPQESGDDVMDRKLPPRPSDEDPPLPGAFRSGGESNFTNNRNGGVNALALRSILSEEGRDNDVENGMFDDNAQRQSLPLDQNESFATTSESTSQGLVGENAHERGYSSKQPLEQELDAPIAYAADDLPQSLTAHLVDEAVEQERLQHAEAQGRAAVLAQVVEADVEPIATDPGKDVSARRSFLFGRKPIFYFMLGVLFVIVVLVAVVTPLVLTGTAGPPIPTKADSGDDDDQAVFVQPLSCDVAYPLEPDEVVQASLTIGTGPPFESRCENAGSAPWQVRWFKVKGGSQLPALNVTICEQDAESVVETGLFLEVTEGGCDDQGCLPIDGRFLSRTCQSYAWFVKPGAEYVLSVSDVSGEPTNGFSIQVSETTFVENLSCESPLDVALNGPIVLENLNEEENSGSSPSSYTACDGAVTSTSTRWYRIRGDSLAATALVCTRSMVDVSVRREADCPNIEACSPLQLQRKDAACMAHSWTSNAGDSHLLAIATSSPDVVGVALNIYANDECEWAYPIPTLPFSDTANTSTVSASFDAKAFVCPVLFDAFFRGVWYSYTATATGCITITAESPSRLIDPAVAVYVGSCTGELGCLSTNDDIDPLNLNSEVTFDATIGTTYRILLFATRGQSGLMEFTVSQSETSCERQSTHKECTLCPNRMPPELLVRDEDVALCSSLNEEADFVLDDFSTCHVFRVFGVSTCGCATDITETCNACPDGSPVPNPNLLLPLTNVSCGSLQTTPKLSPNVTCEEQTDSVARYCGCPTTPNCSMCGLGQPVTNPDGVVQGETTCAALDLELQLRFLSRMGIECGDFRIEDNFQRLYGANVIGFCCRQEDL